MSIFDKAKQGVDVAKFKADQLLRVNKVQNEAGALRREILGVREKIAEAVVQLHKQGPLTYPDVEDLCLKIDQIEAQIAEKDAQVAAIRPSAASGSGCGGRCHGSLRRQPDRTLPAVQSSAADRCGLLP
jgi:hypothetical protein